MTNLREQIEKILVQVLMKHHDDISKQDDDAIAEATNQILQIKCKYCPYVKVVSFTPDSELAKKVIDEQQQEIEKLKLCFAQIRERIGRCCF